MNAAQRDRAIAVIEATPLLCRDELIDARAIPCAIGALALAAGHTVADLDVPFPASYVTTLPGLAREFGLTDAQCDRIETANDSPEMVLSPNEQRAFRLYDDASDGAVYDLSGLRKAAVVATLERMVPREPTALPTWLALAGDLCRPVRA